MGQEKTIEVCYANYVIYIVCNAQCFHKNINKIKQTLKIAIIQFINLLVIPKNKYLIYSFNLRQMQHKL